MNADTSECASTTGRSKGTAKFTLAPLSHPKGHLSRAEVRRRMAQMPPTRAMVSQLLRVIEDLKQENACLSRKLGC